MKPKFKEQFRSYVVITAGALIVAAGIYFFKFPNNFATGGVSGLAVILAKVAALFTQAQYMLFFNITLLVLGHVFLGPSFAIKTVFASVLISLTTEALELFVPLAGPLTHEKLLDLSFAMILTAAGSAILFNEGASSGGTDILAMIIRKYLHIDQIGTALLVTDFLLAGSAAFIFDIETGLCSLLGLLLKAFVMDRFIESFNMNKCFLVVTDQHELIENYILETLKRGATVHDCEGAFMHTGKKLIITVIHRGQGAELKNYIHQVDPHAFTIILNSSDILGKGFKTIA